MAFIISCQSFNTSLFLPPNVFSLSLFKYTATHTVWYPFLSVSLSFCRSFSARTFQTHRWIVLSEPTSSRTSHSGSLQSNYSILVNLATVWQAAWPGKPGLDKVYYKPVNFSSFLIYRFILDFYHPWRDLELFMKSGVLQNRGSDFTCHSWPNPLQKYGKSSAFDKCILGPHIKILIRCLCIWNANTCK